ncbi:MAG: hypothetical protein JXL97_09405 [Bacteroidales bacterium]|nr:hypothetical protein [Bacteroidales bacterium]
MTLNERVLAFAKLADFMLATANEDIDNIDRNLINEYHSLNELIKTLKIYNPWFIEPFVRNQLKSLALVMTKEKIDSWILPYAEKIDNITSKRVGVIMAGNIALVGFHDFVSVLLAGHHFVGKISSKDEHLPKKIAEILVKIEPKFSDKITFLSGKLENYNAVIATGSNNSARYFEYYFSKVPHIIRTSRNSLAVLNGNESKQDLENLADDMLLYFGLGCRNISKVFVPKNYKFDFLFEAIYKHRDLFNHNKYANNYDYNRAIFLMNRVDFLENGFFIIKPDFSLASPVSVLHYEYYEDLEIVSKYIENQQNALQCIVSNEKQIAENVLDFGTSQIPELFDYEDGINTIEFLTEI